MKASKIFLIDLVTLMPEMFGALTNFGVVGRGFKERFVDINFIILEILQQIPIRP